MNGFIWALEQKVENEKDIMIICVRNVKNMKQEMKKVIRRSYNMR